MLVSAYSNRIYKKQINKYLQNMLRECNDIKIALYSLVVREKLDVKDLNTTYVIQNYGVNTYFANMIIRKVKETLESRNELQKEYISQIEEQIVSQNERIEKFENKLIYWRTMKDKIVKSYKHFVNETIFPYQFKNNKVYYKDKEYELWEFELYVDRRIRQIKNSIYHAKNKLNRLNQKLENMKKKAPISCFGGKDFFKKQFTVDGYIQNHKQWRKEFDAKRHSNFTISGCANYEDGSMCVRYNVENEVLSIMSHKQSIIPKGKKYAKSEWFEIPCKFKYREQEYLEAISQRNTVAYEIIDKGEYFIIKADFELEKNKNEDFLTTCLEGVNSLDINVDRYAITELDKHGNLLKRKVIYFDLDGLSSNQITKVLEKAAIEIANFCGKNGKPLVREDISIIKFKPTGDAKTNKQLTQFAYDKMISTTDRCCFTHNIEIYKINPMYTSQQGKLKYMAKYGMSTHESAAFCVGRRFLFSLFNKDGKVTKLYYENLGQYKRFGKIKTVAKAFQKLKTHNIFKLNNLKTQLKDYKKLNKYIEAVNQEIYG